MNGPRPKPAHLGELELAELRRRYEEEPSGSVAPGAVPAPRDRDFSTLALTTARYSRYESTNGFVAVADAYAQVIEFSGLPDSVEIWVLDNDIEIQFLNDRGGKNESITLLASNFYEPGIVYNSLIARNLVALSIGRIQVVGKWVSR